MCTKTYDTFIEIKHFPKLEMKQDNISTLILVINLLVNLMKFAPFGGSRVYLHDNLGVTHIFVYSNQTLF